MAATSSARMPAAADSRQRLATVRLEIGAELLAYRVQANASNGARADRVHRDVVPRGFDRQRLRQRNDSRLGDTVRAPQAIAALTGH